MPVLCNLFMFEMINSRQNRLSKKIWTKWSSSFSSKEHKTSTKRKTGWYDDRASNGNGRNNIVAQVIFPGCSCCCSSQTFGKDLLSVGRAQNRLLEEGSKKRERERTLTTRSGNDDSGANPFCSASSSIFLLSLLLGLNWGWGRGGGVGKKYTGLFSFSDLPLSPSFLPYPTDGRDRRKRREEERLSSFLQTTGVFPPFFTSNELSSRHCYMHSSFPSCSLILPDRTFHNFRVPDPD